jgi:hypothetical protein
MIWTRDTVVIRRCNAESNPIGDVMADRRFTLRIRVESRGRLRRMRSHFRPSRLLGEV